MKKFIKFYYKIDHIDDLKSLCYQTKFTKFKIVP
jgi:hypothetical protein